MANFLTVLLTAVLRAQSKICGGAYNYRLVAVNFFAKNPHHKCWTMFRVKKTEIKYFCLTEK